MYTVNIPSSSLIRLPLKFRQGYLGMISETSVVIRFGKTIMRSEVFEFLLKQCREFIWCNLWCLIKFPILITLYSCRKLMWLSSVIDCALPWRCDRDHTKLVHPDNGTFGTTDHLLKQHLCPILNSSTRYIYQSSCSQITAACHYVYHVLTCVNLCFVVYNVK